jgi:hypothetical protein
MRAYADRFVIAVLLSGRKAAPFLGPRHVGNPPDVKPAVACDGHRVVRGLE